MSDYPYEPGVRAGSASTSADAAARVAAGSGRFADRLFALIRDEGPASPEMLTARLKARGEHVLLNSVRARVCQLHKQGRVRDSGRRGLGESQRAKVVIWEVAS